MWERIGITMEKKIQITTCPTCGADMKYSPATGGLVCDYCNSHKEIVREKTINETDLNEVIRRGVREWQKDDILLARCENCGAELVFEPTSQAKNCHYCGSASINLISAEDTISPGYVIPFSIQKTEALQAFDKWIKKKFFAPSKLKKMLRLDKLQGLYIPFWTFDAEVRGRYTAERGDYYYVTKTREVDGKTETYQERHTRWTFVSGEYEKFFDDTVVLASSKIDAQIARKMSDFKFEELVQYKPEFLAGFVAEKYSVPLEEGWQLAKKEIADEAVMDIRRQIGGDEISGLEYELDYQNQTFKHLLLPIWMTGFNYKEKLYHVMINGSLGEVEGEYPKSVLKILLTIALIAAGIGGAYYWMTRY